MASSLRITVDDLRKRMESGEDFVVMDTRNAQEWAKSDVKIPEAVRATSENLSEILSGIPKEKPIVAYCT